MAQKVFISYRRDDSSGHAGRVHDRLEREFGRDLLFMDVDAIPLGADFVKVLGEEVAKCNVLLAIIGPNWVDARDEAGRRRLESRNDFVRIEITAALRRDIPVIPILLEGTRMPRPEQLPDDLKGLARRNGLDVRHASFHSDMDKLVRGLRGNAARTVQQRKSHDQQYRAEGRIKIDAKIIHGAPDGWFKPGLGKTEWFRDHPDGPQMVVLPAGSFMMGSSRSEIGALTLEYGWGWAKNEGPQHKVTIGRPLAVSRFAVTFDEWDAFVTAGGWSKDRPSDESWGRGRYPVINVGWDDAKAYVAWLSDKTGKAYRLLSEAEWEYAARAGTTTPFWWGSSISTSNANYNPNYTFRGSAKGTWLKRTVPVDSFEPNPWGLYQVHGNVWEWCEDTWRETYDGASNDGSPYQRGDTVLRVVRGGSWDSSPGALRAARRHDQLRGSHHIGLRVARTTNP